MVSTRIGEQSISAISPCRPLVHDDVAATAKTSTGGIRYGREARRTHCTLPWLLQRIGCWGRVWSPPLPAPVALFQLFPCGRRWHSQNPITPSFRLLSMAPQLKANARHVSAFLCVPLSILTSPHQVVPKYISLDTGISRRLNMPAATSPTSLLVPLFCPNFSQNSRERHSVNPSYPHIHPISPLRTWCFSRFKPYYRIQSCIQHHQQNPTAGILLPSSLCAGVLVYLAWAANLFENHRIFSHLSRDLHHTSGVKTAPILKTGN